MRNEFWRIVILAFYCLSVAQQSTGGTAEYPLCRRKSRTVAVTLATSQTQLWPQSTFRF